MNIRKIAAAATFATGAALAFAPLAAARRPHPCHCALDSEISAENSLFELYALFAGDTADITKGGAGVFDTFTSGDSGQDAPHLIASTANYGQVTPLETDLYGANPILAGISSDTGPYSEFNGALVPVLQRLQRRAVRVGEQRRAWTPTPATTSKTTRSTMR